YFYEEANAEHYESKDILKMHFDFIGRITDVAKTTQVKVAEQPAPPAEPSVKATPKPAAKASSRKPR
ncbi:hypothetical protein K2X33_05640, partial [bacterium]|nr:hypothetical protein [bacterium]